MWYQFKYYSHCSQHYNTFCFVFVVQCVACYFIAAMYMYSMIRIESEKNTHSLNYVAWVSLIMMAFDLNENFIDTNNDVNMKTSSGLQLTVLYSVCVLRNCFVSSISALKRLEPRQGAGTYSFSAARMACVT